jgi:hypothetical protein
MRRCRVRSGQRVLAGAPASWRALRGQSVGIVYAPGAALTDAGLGGGRNLRERVAMFLVLVHWWSVIFLPGIPLAFDLSSKGSQ